MTTDNACQHCRQPQILDGVGHPMVHLGRESYHLDCLSHELETALAATHGLLIDYIKNDTGRDYAARAAFANERAQRLARGQL